MKMTRFLMLSNLVKIRDLAEKRQVFNLSDVRKIIPNRNSQYSKNLLSTLTRLQVLRKDTISSPNALYSLRRNNDISKT